ncbi:enoyl-CoA hydratase-related protein [Microbacterium sp. A93]|uniref:enoyl-CoA hydratase-related protein n=1 Tax=Microbacterium sp. A93 TaxID=3450716 RepID=UPI003F42ECCA
MSEDENISLLGCPIWATVLGQTAPEYLSFISEDELIELLGSADSVIGGYRTMGAEMIAALNDANRDPSIGVVVLTHDGPNFGVGGNVAGLHSSTDGGDVVIGEPTPDMIIGRMLKPVIAVVRGYVIGLHNHLAYHCDFTIAGESAVFGQAGPRVGRPISGSLVAVAGTIIGDERARQMWMVAEQLTAQEALEWGVGEQHRARSAARGGSRALVRCVARSGAHQYCRHQADL